MRMIGVGGCGWVGRGGVGGVMDGETGFNRRLFSASDLGVSMEPPHASDRCGGGVEGVMDGKTGWNRALSCT